MPSPSSAPSGTVAVVRLGGQAEHSPFAITARIVLEESSQLQFAVGMHRTSGATEHNIGRSFWSVPWSAVWLVGRVDLNWFS